MTPDFDWNCARAFLAVLDAGGFTAAARTLGLSQPTVSRHVASLERQLGATLFERAGPTLRPTPLAAELAEHVRAMEQSAQRLALSAVGRATELRGMVRISASEPICVFLLPPIVRALRRAYPHIQIELVASSDVSDLWRREADIAIRNFRPRSPELIARKVGELRARMYATPAYLDHIGNPRTVEGLQGADFISFAPRSVYLEGLKRVGLPLSEDDLPLVSGSGLVHWALGRQDTGICLLMEEIGDADPRLVRVLESHLPPFPVPIWLTCRREIRTTARYRVVFDQLAAAFGRPLVAWSV